MFDPESVGRSLGEAFGRGDSDAALALRDKQMKRIEARRSRYYTGEIVDVGTIVEAALGPTGRRPTC